MEENPFDRYVCPKCKGQLQPQSHALYCAGCQRAYPVDGGIPDFLLIRPEASPNPILRNIRVYGWLAGFYEGPWYSFLLWLYAGSRVLSLDRVAAYVRQVIQPVRGLVLDVGTGTATYGRRVGGPERTVYGIDLSMDMMRVGQAYLRREGVTQMHLARADVEAIPFPDGLFDGCIASGCLHLFPDKLKALTEISRTLKPGAPLVGVTFTWGEAGLLKHQAVRRLILRRGRAQPFSLPDLERLLDHAGFGEFNPTVKGSILLFAAAKKGP